MDECESLDSEMAELQEFQSEPSEAISQDDEDELEELQNSLREVVQDRSVKPKVQCLMVDPSFSMVTVQSEDSGIVWETASSRCSTPWASETSSVSEAYSMEGSGAAGKITVLFDEEKVVRRKTRSGGRSSRLSDRFSRPGSSRSASALGVERPEMAEVSIPNVKQEQTETEPDLEEIKSKDQQLFSLISEGYEILNIRVPSKLPTVDEEESTELQDNLSYLDQTPKIRSRDPHDWTQQHIEAPLEEGEMLEPSKPESCQLSADRVFGHSPQKDSHIDYFEKFTLLDQVVPEKDAAKLQEVAERPTVTPTVEKQKPEEETAEVCQNSSPASEESFVFVTDVEIVGEHLDEVFYGEDAPADALHRREDYEEETRMRMRRESQRSVKESGSVLFEKEETTLTPIYISSGPPKIIDPILLEEPTAMSFMYSDLYEDAVGERRRSDEEFSEAESVASEKSYKRCWSDSEEADGYLEKFTLKDETPTVEAQPEPAEDPMEGRMMWSQSAFEMTGCLIRAVEEEAEPRKETEISVKDGSDEVQSAESDQRTEVGTENDQEKQLPTETREDAFKISAQESKLREDQTEETDCEAKRDRSDPPDIPADEPLSEEVDKTENSVAHPREQESTAGSEQPCQTEKKGMQSTEEAATETPVDTETPAVSLAEVDIQTETTEKALCEKASTDTKAVDSKSKVRTNVFTQPKTEGMLTSTDIEASSETLQCEEEEAIEVLPEHVGPVEVITDFGSAVQAIVEISEKAVREEEIQTQVHIDLQEASGDTTDAHAVDNGPEALRVEAPAESEDSELITETEISCGATKPEVQEGVSKESEREHPEVSQSEKSEQHQQQESAAESDESKPITGVEVAEDGGARDKDTVNGGDDFILLVPKGQTVEMDVNIGQWSDKTASVVVALPEPVSAVVDTAAHTQREPIEPMPEPSVEKQPEVAVKEEEPCRNDLDQMSSPPASATEAGMGEHGTERDTEEDEGILSTPQEVSSGLQREAVQAEEVDGEQRAEMHKAEDAPELMITTEEESLERILHEEEIGQKTEEDEIPAAAARVPIHEPEYEVIYERDATDKSESETPRDTETPKPESGPDVQEEEKALDLSADEALIEDDYEIIDAEEESQARMAAELLGMDWFCLTCGCLLSQDNSVCVEHQGHEVKAVDEAYEEIKEKLSDWISELQGKSENIEDLVSELELAYNSVEDQCVESDTAMQAQNDEMMAQVMEQYNNMSVSMEEEKKAKLEQLYDQIVSFQESIDSAKATLETTAREADTDACSHEDIHARLKAALDCTTSLELGPQGLLVFKDYAKGNTSSSQLAQRKGIPVPQRPTLQPQDPGSATSTSVTVYWKVNTEDIIDCFQVYCMEDPQGAVSEEYRVTVKESYCVLEELEPDKTYKVWVMAVNYTGCSLPSERLTFRTAPSVPVIDTERCTIMWDSATLRWNSATPAAAQSYTLEYCRQYELEGEGLRSIAGIKSCEHKVLLQPSENYLFYIKAVNEAGASEQSEAALISTKGTRFHLLKASAHPALELSVDESTVHYSPDTDPSATFADNQCPSILGELFPARGRYYWETAVSQSTAYRLGVMYGTASRNSSLGENRLSWCLQCVPTPSGCRYQLLHDDVQSSVFVIETPERVGTLLDYQHGRLSFYNAQTGQLLSSFSQRFAQPCHPALALEMPGSLEISMVVEVPEFTKDS